MYTRLKSKQLNSISFVFSLFRVTSIEFLDLLQMNPVSIHQLNVLGDIEGSAEEVTRQVDLKIGEMST